MTEVPAPFKAVVGLVATALDRLPEPRQLPEKAVELPVLAVSAVLQASLRAQQVYAELTARGDEAIATLRGAPAEPPSWASFDDEPDGAGAGAELSDGLGDGGGDLSQIDPLGAEDLLSEDETPDGDALEGGDTMLGAAQASLLDATPASSPIAGNGSGYLGSALGRGPSAFDLADDLTVDAEPGDLTVDAESGDRAGA